MFMQWTDVLDCLGKGNSASMRILKSVESEDELGPIMVGFANGQGGRVIIGIDVKNCHFIGTTLDQSYVEELIRLHCLNPFPVQVEQVRRADRALLSVQVSEAPRKPVAFKQECYMISTESPYLPVMFSPPEPLVFQVIESQTIAPPQEIHEEYAPPQAPSIFQAPSVPITMNTRQNKTMSHLNRHGSISNKVYRQLFGVSHKTAHLELVDLVDKGVLKSQGAGRSTSYALR